MPGTLSGGSRNVAAPAGNGAGAVPARGFGDRGSPSAPSAPSGPRLALATPPIEMAEPLAAPALRPGAEPAPMPRDFAEIVALFEQHREAVLRSHLWSNCHLVHFEPGRIELRLAEAAPRDLPNRLGQLLGTWTGARWVVSVSREAGAPSLREQAERHARHLRSEAAEHPMVRAGLEIFPGATIEAVRELPPPVGAPAEIADADEASDGEDVA